MLQATLFPVALQALRVPQHRFQPVCTGLLQPGSAGTPALYLKSGFYVQRIWKKEARRVEEESEKAKRRAIREEKKNERLENESDTKSASETKRARVKIKKERTVDNVKQTNNKSEE